MRPSAAAPEVADLVLVGGGHSHALLLRMLAMDPIAGLRLTLVSDVAHAPYSGMLPGLIAGIYSHDEAHIDLRRLATIAGASFVHAAATGLDAKQKLVHIDDGSGRPPLPYDILSINVGSVPATPAVSGAAEHAVPAKPVPLLIAAISALAKRLAAEPRRTERITVVGGGAGGTELALALTARFGARVTVTVVTAGSELLESHPSGMRRLLAQVLRKRDAVLSFGDAVARVEAGLVTLASGKTIAHDLVLWVTSPMPPVWLEKSGLARDAGGFLRLRDTMQTIDFPEVFAAGDCAAIDGAPRAKSGVYAVRHARPLVENLRRYLLRQDLLAFKPQKQYLSLVGTGDGRAVGARSGGFFLVSGAWVWTVKDRIDRAFMAKFAELAPGIRSMAPEPVFLPGVEALARRRLERCAGCAAKVGADVLTEVLARLGGAVPATKDDAASISVPGGMQIVQSVDYLTELVSDPFQFGVIAANHAFSDVFAMGATPHSALAIVHAPLAARGKMAERIFQMLAGIVHATKDAGASLIGGHTGEAAEAGIGLTVNGFVPGGATLRKGGARPGDALVLTKALGTGTIFAAAMRGEAKGAWIDAAIASMLTSNRGAAEALRNVRVHALTDVTGFGLVGHLGEMLAAGDVAADLDLDLLPILPGAAETAARGILSTLHPQNAEAAALLSYRPERTASPAWPLAFDPQTSGGLLAAVAADDAEKLVAALRRRGLAHAAIIGRIRARDPDSPRGTACIEVS